MRGHVFNTLGARSATVLAIAASAALAQAATPAQSPAAEAALADPVKLADENVRARGRVTYEQFCMACHGRELEGGEGPKLVDYETLHGGSPADIRRTIVDGVAAKGMPGFGPVFEPAVLDELVSYIVSQRRGWSKLSFEIRPLPGLVPKDYDYSQLAAIEPIKTGEFHDRLADFGLPEAEHYAMSVEGELNVPYGKDVYVLAQGFQNFDMQLELDGEIVEPVGFDFGTLHPVPPGKHNVRLTYATTHFDNAAGQDFPVTLASRDRKQYFEGLSAAGDALTNEARHEVLAQAATRTVRRRTANLPGTPLDVGLPGGMNFAFDTRSCAVVGVWSGDFLDIGPNVNRRSRDPAAILGNWIYKGGKGIRFVADGSNDQPPTCQFRSISLADPSAPVINFVTGGKLVTLTARNLGTALELAFDAAGTGTESFTLALPGDRKVQFAMPDGTAVRSAIRYTASPDGADLTLHVSASGAQETNP